MTKAHRGLMIFEELHNRYGTHIARRVQQELSSTEFAQVAVDELSSWLESRAEMAHHEYEALRENPLGYERAGLPGSDHLGILYKRWQQAEELAYVISIADDVSSHAHIAVGGK